MTLRRDHSRCTYLKLCLCLDHVSCSSLQTLLDKDLLCFEKLLVRHALSSCFHMGRSDVLTGGDKANV